MDMLMHERISANALEILSDSGIVYSLKFREVLRAASNYPDIFGLADSIPSPKHEIADVQWRDYMMIPHAGRKICFGELFNSLSLRKTGPDIVVFWLENLCHEFTAGNETRAAKFAGCLSHLIGDTGQAAHLMDERLLQDIFPQKNACYLTHRTLEAITAEIPHEKYVPRILGFSPHELEWRLLEELVILNRREKKELPILFAAIENKDLTKQRKSAAKTARHCAELFADVLFTVRSILNGSISVSEDSVVALHSLNPVEMFCDSYFNYSIMIDRISGKDIYSPMSLDLGNGPESGIAMLVRLTPGITDEREAYAEYSLPPGIFASFSAKVGLCRNIHNQGGAIFQIYTDGKCIFETPALTADSAPFTISCSIQNAKNLRLRVIDARGKNQKTALFFYPIWINPVLKRVEI
ncbi:MAG: NPCBM/NEW2 domain protein [Lentisphaerae bacterium ADurb.Bin242]|nr:MAG: NPCBM/NEW2 domain protein [Lentisphaerae bacterium ADurb.Bin242]